MILNLFSQLTNSPDINGVWTLLTENPSNCGCPPAPTVYNQDIDFTNVECDICSYQYEVDNCATAIINVNVENSYPCSDNVVTINGFSGVNSQIGIGPLNINGVEPNSYTIKVTPNGCNDVFDPLTDFYIHKPGSCVTPSNGTVYDINEVVLGNQSNFHPTTANITYYAYIECLSDDFNWTSCEAIEQTDCCNLSVDVEYINPCMEDFQSQVYKYREPNITEFDFEVPCTAKCVSFTLNAFDAQPDEMVVEQIVGNTSTVLHPNWVYSDTGIMRFTVIVNETQTNPDFPILSDPCLGNEIKYIKVTITGTGSQSATTEWQLDANCCECNQDCVETHIPCISNISTGAGGKTYFSIDRGYNNTSPNRSCRNITQPFVIEDFIDNSVSINCTTIVLNNYIPATTCPNGQPLFEGNVQFTSNSTNNTITLLFDDNSDYLGIKGLLNTVYTGPDLYYLSILFDSDCSDNSETVLFRYILGNSDCDAQFSHTTDDVLQKIVFTGAVTSCNSLNGLCDIADGAFFFFGFDFTGNYTVVQEAEVKRLTKSDSVGFSIATNQIIDCPNLMKNNYKIDSVLGTNGEFAWIMVGSFPSPYFNTVIQKSSNAPGNSGDSLSYTYYGSGASTSTYTVHPNVVIGECPNCPCFACDGVTPSFQNC